MKARRFEIFIIIAIIAVIGIVYAFTQKPAMAPTADYSGQNQQGQSAQQVPTQTVTYKGVSGKTALSLLEASHRVDLKHYSFGDLVTGIDGISPDSTHFWAFYVNSKLSDVGSSTYVTKSSDTIEWKIDEVKSQ